VSVFPGFYYQDEKKKTTGGGDVFEKDFWEGVG
jgi:hypothetical protein